MKMPLKQNTKLLQHHFVLVVPEKSLKKGLIEMKKVFAGIKWEFLPLISHICLTVYKRKIVVGAESIFIFLVVINDWLTRNMLLTLSLLLVH